MSYGTIGGDLSGNGNAELLGEINKVRSEVLRKNAEVEKKSSDAAKSAQDAVNRVKNIDKEQNKRIGRVESELEGFKVETLSKIQKLSEVEPVSTLEIEAQIKQILNNQGKNKDMLVREVNELKKDVDRALIGVLEAKKLIPAVPDNLLTTKEISGLSESLAELREKVDNVESGEIFDPTEIWTQLSEYNVKLTSLSAKNNEFTKKLKLSYTFFAIMFIINLLLIGVICYVN